MSGAVRGNISTVKGSSFKPMRNRVFVTDIEQGEKKSKGGLIITDDNGKDHGIRPRWAKVWAVGEDVVDIEVGQWILIEHGRWSFKIQMEINGEDISVWDVDYAGDCILLVTDEKPE